MIDTHAHLTDPVFANDLSPVLTRAEAAGVHSIICVSNTPSDGAAALSLHAHHPHIVHAALGLHPENATTIPSSVLPSHLGMLSTLSANLDVVALGEVGLDHTPHILSLSPDAKPRQQAAFHATIQLSQNNNLPLSIHSRAAGRHVLDILIEASTTGQAPRACMHAFDGRPIHAERALLKLPNTLFFSIPPIAKRQSHFVRLARRIPLDRLLLESDAPALAPIQGDRNEPANLTEALAVIAEAHAVSSEHAAVVLTDNARRLFDRLPR